MAISKYTTWLASYISVFRDRMFDEYPEDFALCCQVGINKIEWPTELIKTCPYCGSEFDSITCPGCQQKIIRSENYIGRAKVTLYGNLPVAAMLFKPSDEVTYCILHHCRGDRRRYNESSVIMKFTNCKHVGMYMGNVSALTPYDDEPLTLYSVVECDVELFPENG